EVLGRSLNDLIVPEELRAEAREITRAGDRRGSLSFETVRVRKDGTRIPVSVIRVLVTLAPEGRRTAEYAIYRDIRNRTRAEQVLHESEGRHRYIFHAAGVSIWEEDFSQVKAAIDDLKAQDVGNFGQYLAAHPDFVRQAITMVKIIDVNDATIKLFRAESKDELLGSLRKIFLPETEEVFAGELIAI